MASTYSDPAYYKKLIPPAIAQQQAGRLGISTDQLYKYFAQIGDPGVFNWTPTQGAAANQSYGGFGASQPMLKTSGIEQLVAANKGGGAGTGQAIGAAVPAGGGISAAPGYYSAGTPGGVGGVGGAGGGGGSTTMADGQQPESVALKQMAQIDPTSEALRQKLAASYLGPLQQAGAPTAAQFQSYLNLARQVDPTTAAARAQLGSDLASQEALGTHLDAATQREVEQATRRAQIGRGNVYGTPQMVEEAMTRGQAGLALQQQRQQALQSYLQSGQTPGDVAMNLYNQQQSQLRANQGAAVGYLGSGQTPYQAGAGYLNTAEQRAAAAAQGGATYQPQGPSGYYTGQGSSSFPQYGLDMSQLSNQWYNSINQWNMQSAALGQSGGPSTGQRVGKAAGGALAGAASGALAGGGVFSIPGAIIGGIGGAASGYFS